MSELFGIAPFVKKAEEANPAKPGDYLGEDGLLYCGECHSAKQCRVLERTVPCMCRCAAEKYNREQMEREHRRKVARLKELAFDIPAMESCTFENDRGGIPVMDAARRYVEHFEEIEADGKGLLLWGSVGRGKSYAAASIVNALCEREIVCRYTSMGQILGDLRNFKEDQRDYFDRLNAARLLVIDDLGAERDTPYSAEIVFGLIDLRCRSGKPLIITTNLDIDEIKNPAAASQARIYSRLLERCHPIRVEGGDQRKAAAAAGYSGMKELLGM